MLIFTRVLPNSMVGNRVCGSLNIENLSASSESFFLVSGESESIAVSEPEKKAEKHNNKRSETISKTVSIK